MLSPDTFAIALRVIEVCASCITAASLFAIAVHELTNRPPRGRP